MTSDASTPGKSWIFLKIFGEGVFFTLFFEGPYYLLLGSFPQKSRLLGGEAHKVPWRSRKDHLLWKTLEWEQAHGPYPHARQRQMNGTRVPIRLRLLKFLCPPAVRRMKAKLPLGARCQHSPQTMAWLSPYCTFCIHFWIPLFFPFCTMCKALLFTGEVLNAQVQPSFRL